MTSAVPDPTDDILATVRRVLTDVWSTSDVRAVQADPVLAHSERLWKEIAAGGWVGLSVPEEIGGSGLPWPTLGAVCREAGRALVPSTLYSSLHAALLLAARASSGEGDVLLSRLLGGAVGTVAALERDRFHVPLLWTTCLRRQGGGFTLDGEKLFVQNGAQSDIVLVAAIDEGGRLGLASVEAGTPGVSIVPHETFGRDKQSRMSFDGVRVDASCVLAFDDGQFLETWNEITTKMTALICMDMVGGTDAIIERTVRYVTDRHVFGKPIGTYQAAQHLLADVAIAAKGAELASVRAIQLVGDGTAADRAVRIAKVAAGRAYKQASVIAHQLHGGMGYVRETDLHLWSNRAVADDALFGPGPYHLDLLGRENDRMKGGQGA